MFNNGFNINELRSLSGSRLNRSSESLGLGAEYADESWKQTYKTIMNSKESPAFHMLAAESAFGYDTVLQFSIENLVHNLSVENAVLDIIDPLKKSNSTEANNIYYKLVERMSLEADGFGQKVKDAAGRVWTAIKEAFKKLRLAFTHMIAGIKRFILVAANSKDAKDLWDQKDKIRSAMKDPKISVKTIKALTYSKTQLVNAKNSSKVSETNTYLSMVLNEIQNTLNDDISGRIKNTTNIRGELDRYKSQWETKIDNAFKKGGLAAGGAKGLLTGKSDLTVKKLLYGNNPSVKEVQLKAILTEDNLGMLAPNYVLSMKSGISEIDRNIKNINNTITSIEKIEKGMKHNEAKDVKRANLEQLQLLRSMVSKFGQLMKDISAETFRMRGVVIRAAKAALGSSGKSASEKDYQKSQKAADKSAKANVGKADI